MILLFPAAGAGTQISRMANLSLTARELDLVVLIKLGDHEKMVYEHACWSWLRPTSSYSVSERYLKKHEMLRFKADGQRWQQLFIAYSDSTHKTDLETWGSDWHLDW